MEQSLRWQAVQPTHVHVPHVEAIRASRCLLQEELARCISRQIEDAPVTQTVEDVASLSKTTSVAKLTRFPENEISLVDQLPTDVRSKVSHLFEKIDAYNRTGDKRWLRRA